MVQLIPHIKSAYQIRSCVKMTIKRRTQATTILFDFKHWHLHRSWSDKALMSPKRILNVDLTYLLKSAEFFHRF